MRRPPGPLVVFAHVSGFIIKFKFLIHFLIMTTLMYAYMYII